MSVVGLQACEGAQLISFIDAVIMQVGVSRTGGKFAIRTLGNGKIYKLQITLSVALQIIK